MHVLADGPHVGVGLVAEARGVDVVAAGQLRLVRLVGRRREQVEPGLAVEPHVARAAPDVQHVVAAHLVPIVVDRYRPGTVEAHDRELPAVAEAPGAQLVRHGQVQHAARGRRAADDDAVVMAVDEAYLAGHEEVLDQETVADPA